MQETRHRSIASLLSEYHSVFAQLLHSRAILGALSLMVITSIYTTVYNNFWGVLFTGKLMLLLLVYIREDAVVVRQPIYGLLIGNLLLFALAFLTRHHGADSVLANRHADCLRLFANRPFLSCLLHPRDLGVDVAAG